MCLNVLQCTLQSLMSCIMIDSCVTMWWSGCACVMMHRWWLATTLHERLAWLMVLRNQAMFMPSCMCSCLWYKDSEATPEPCFALLPYNHVNSVMVYAALRLCILSIQQYLSIYLYVNLSIYLSTYLVSAYIYKYTHTYVYIYIHVGRERRRE